MDEEALPSSPLLIMRGTTISVSEEEKKALDEVKIGLYNTDEVPYGAVIYELAGRFIDSQNDR